MDLVTDISVYQPWIARKNADQSVTITFVDSNGAAFSLTPYTFIAELWRMGASSAFLTMTSVNGGTSGVLALSLTNSQLNIAPSKDYFWVLRTTAPTDSVWFTGPFTLNAATWNGSPTSSISQTVSLSHNITATITPGTSGPLSIGTYSTALTFNQDEDIYHDATGTSPVFTLSSSGNVNGREKYLRLNKPTGFSFSSSFEATPGSSSVDATKLNVIVLTYFSNWNGSGQAHVVYSNTLLTAL